MKKIIEFFTTEHLMGNLLTLIVLGIGIISLISLRREVWPKVDFETTMITMILPGASPEQMEKLMVSPMEEGLREVDGIKKIYSTSTENTAIIIMQLDPDSRDVTETNDDIQQAVDSVKNLPEEAEDPVVSVLDTSKSPIIEVTVSGTANPLKLRESSKFVRDALLEIPGVASVGKEGFREREFYVEVDPQKLASKGIPLSSVIQAIQVNNVSSPAGSVKDIDGNETLIKTDSELLSAKDILSIPISSNDEGANLKVSDIATVIERLEEPDQFFRANGQRSINLVVMKKQNADVLEMVSKVFEVVESLKPNMPEGVELSTANDFSVYVKNRISVLGSNLLIGLLLVVLVLTMLLPFRVSMVVAMGIPVAILATVIVINSMGVSMNMISLIGMIIVLGMVVDDAIVVCENIWRYYELGYSTKDAVVKGTLEVLGPITASVLTTVIAFAPLGLMSGIMGKFIAEIPLVVILALIFSLLEAIIIMPSHFAAWVPHPQNGNETKSANSSRPKGILARILGLFGFGKSSENKKKAVWFDNLVEHYGRYVSWSLRHRAFIMILMFVGTVVSAVIIGMFSRFILFPTEGIETFFVRFEGPKQFSLDLMEEQIVEAEKQVLTLPKTEVKDIITIVGLSRQEVNDPLTKRGSNYGQIQVILTPENSRDRKSNEIIAELREKIKLKRDDIKMTFAEMKGGPPQGRPISIDLIGEDFEYLNKVAGEVQEHLKIYEDVSDIQSSYIQGKDQIRVKPHLEKMALANLNAKEISLTTRASFEGVVASTVRDLEDEIDIRVSLRESDKKVTSQLDGVRVGNSLGNLIDLSAIADFYTEPTVSAIFHKSYKRMVNVSSEIDTEKVTSMEMIKKIKPFLEKLQVKHPLIRVEISGENEDTEESMSGLFRSFFLALIGIAALLIITFKKIVQPAVILFAIPMGVMGAIYALMIHGMPMSFMAMLGIVALSGVIVNNAIVLISFINQLRDEGANRYVSIIEAAKTRLRPVFMTTLTTVSGLLPTAYGWGGSDPFIEPLALSLGWGLAIGAFFISLFFPVLISLVDDMYYFLGLWKKKVFTSEENANS